MKKFYLCKLCLIVFGALLAVHRTYGFTVATNSSCSNPFQTTYKFEFLDDLTRPASVIIYMQQNMMTADILMAATSNPSSANLILGPDIPNADMAVCKSNDPYVKSIFVTQDPSYLGLAHVTIGLLTHAPIGKDNFYVIHVDESSGNDFSAAESVGLIPAIWYLNGQR